MRKRGELYKRGSIWWCWIAGKRVSTKCRDRQAALLAKARLEREHADPVHHAAHSATIAGAIAKFLEERANKGRAAGTLDMYRQKAGHLTRIFGEECRLSTIDAASVDRFIAQRLEETAKRHTIHKELVTLRGILKLAKRRGEYGPDIAAVLPVGFSQGYEPRKTYLTPEQLEALFGELSDHRAAHVAYAVATGARLAETVRAEMRDVSGQFANLRGTKTDKSARTIPVLYDELMTRALRGARSSGPMFDRWQSSHRDLGRACRRAGIPRVTWNDLRRTFGSWLKQAGVSLDDIADLLGHTSTIMVRRVYGQDTPEALGKRVRRALKGTKKRR